MALRAVIWASSTQSLCRGELWAQIWLGFVKRANICMQIKEEAGGEAQGSVFVKYEGEKPTYFSSFILHIISSFQLTKIMATSFSVTSSDSIRGFWKIWGGRSEAI